MAKENVLAPHADPRLGCRYSPNCGDPRRGEGDPRMRRNAAGVPSCAYCPYATRINPDASSVTSNGLFQYKSAPPHAHGCSAAWDAPALEQESGFESHHPDHTRRDRAVPFSTSLASLVAQKPLPDCARNALAAAAAGLRATLFCRCRQTVLYGGVTKFKSLAPPPHIVGRPSHPAFLLQRCCNRRKRAKRAWTLRTRDAAFPRSGHHRISPRT